MAEFNYSKLVAELKKDADLTQGKAAAKLGVAIGQLPMIQFCRAQVEAGIYSALKPATAVQVKKARDSESQRWELIAARYSAGSGEEVGVAKIKALYREAGGDPDKSFTGRGRDFSGVPRSAGPQAAAGRGRGNTTARGGKTPTARGGKTASGRGGKTATTPAVVRRTTKRSGNNPS